jgi:hypothetical protein
MPSPTTGVSSLCSGAPARDGRYLHRTPPRAARHHHDLAGDRHHRRRGVPLRPDHRNDVVTLISKGLNFIGGRVLTVPFRILIAVYLLYRRRRRAFATWVITCAIAEPASARAPSKATLRRTGVRARSDRTPQRRRSDRFTRTRGRRYRGLPLRAKAYALRHSSAGRRTSRDSFKESEMRMIPHERCDGYGHRLLRDEHHMPATRTGSAG